MIEVRFQRGLHLPEFDLWLDPSDAQPFAFLSHAQVDSLARHESSLCSERTAELLKKRFRIPGERLQAVSYHVPVVRDGFRLRLLPAGHIAGSAMLHITRIKDNASLLYTGDFKTRRSRTAEPATFMQADILILESSFGLPSFALPNPMEIESAVLRFVHDAIADGETPVLFGDALGTVQEVLALLAEHGIPALQHPSVAELSEACRGLGLELPETVEFEGHAPPGSVILASPNSPRSGWLRGLKAKRTAMLTGWALQPGAKARYRVDEVIPFADHADHPGLMECLQRVRPRRVLTVHGFAREFAAELRSKRIDAWCAMGGDQLELSIQQSSQRLHAGNVPRHSRAICGLADFSDLCRLVGETSSRVSKASFIASYLGGLEPEEDLRLAADWLGGQALPRGGIPASPAAIRRTLLSMPGVREDRYHEISLSQNDISRTARFVLQELPLKPEPLDLPALDSFFREYAALGDSLERIELLASRLRGLHPVEGETVIKLLTGDLRNGIRLGLLEEAIAGAFRAEREDVRQALMVTGSLGETAVLARGRRLHQAELRPFVPVKPMQYGSGGRETGAAGSPYWAEQEIRGIRAQLHKVGDEAALYAADLRPLDETFPGLLEAARGVSGDFVVDGVIVAGGERDLFAAEGGPAAASPRFVASDVLWSAGEALLAHPLAERRTRLESIPFSGPLECTAVWRSGEPPSRGCLLKDPQAPYLPGKAREDG